MAETISSSIAALSIFLGSHPVLAYTILFVGSYLDAIIGINFIVRGEIFFLAGAILAGTGVLNIVVVSIVLIVSGIIGDSTSYWLGFHHGMKFFREDALILHYKNFERGKRFFDSHGTKTVFLARLLGPLAWVTPFIAGIYRIPYRQFLLYDIPGAIVGIGQFIAVGYIFGANYKAGLAFQERIGLFALAGFIVLLFFLSRKEIAILVKNAKNDSGRSQGIEP